MRARLLCLAVLVALISPTVVPADTVYYRPRGGMGIESVSGTIVQEAGRLVEIVTEDGRTVLIPASDVFQIVRDKPSTTGSSADSASVQPILETPATLGLRNRDPAPLPSEHTSHYGLTAGMNISNLRADPQELEDDDSLRSFALGAWWGRPLTRRVALRAEALYSVKGDAESAGGYTASTRMAYIDVPVVAKVGFRRDATLQPSLFLGPALAINVSADTKLDGEGTDASTDVKDQVRALDVGLVLGGGVDFPLAGRTYGIQLRYSRGLTNAAGDDANGTAHNDVLAIMGSIPLQ